jgi:hypothetical protein
MFERGWYRSIKVEEDVMYCLKREEGLSFSAVGCPPNYIKPLEGRPG